MSDFSDLLHCSKPSLADIRFKAVKVNYDISIIDAIKLSAENLGLKVAVESINNSMNSANEIIIDFSSITGRNDNIMFIQLNQYSFRISYFFNLNDGSITNMKNRILEVVNECNKDSIVNFCLHERVEYPSYIEVVYSSYRIDYIDKNYKDLELIYEHLCAVLDEESNLVKEIEILTNRLAVYINDDLDMNLSGNWNSTEGFEYTQIITTINMFISNLSLQYNRLLKLL